MCLPRLFRRRLLRFGVVRVRLLEELVLQRRNVRHGRVVLLLQPIPVGFETFVLLRDVHGRRLIPLTFLLSSIREEILSQPTTITTTTTTTSGFIVVVVLSCDDEN